LQAARDAEEAADAAGHAADALWLDASGDDDSPTPPIDQRRLLRLMVKSVLVQADKTIKVELDRSDDALADVVRLLADASLKYVRLIETAAAIRPHRERAEENIIGLDLMRMVKRAM
jgi:hypothetical protein